MSVFSSQGVLVLMQNTMVLEITGSCIFSTDLSKQDHFAGWSKVRVTIALSKSILAGIVSGLFPREVGGNILVVLFLKPWAHF